MVYDPNAVVGRWVPAARKGSLTAIAVAFAVLCAITLAIRYVVY